MNVLLHIADPGLGESVALALGRTGHGVSILNPADVGNLPLAEQADAVIVDLADEKGIDVLQALRDSCPEVGRLAIADDAGAAALDARRTGADAILTRPFDVGALERSLAIASRRSRRPPVDPGLIARDRRSQDLLERLETAASSEATLLLVGPLGSGRTRMARFVHAASERSEGPLVEVSCAKLSLGDGERALFGWQGSRSAPGHMQTAHRGTLLLEDVHELPLALQGRLVHALQERCVEPVGATREIPIDIRVVATASTDLAERVATGRFREDLRLRLGVLEVEIPPLCERRADIPALAEQFLEGAARTLGGPRAVLDPNAVAELCERPLPGNLLELEALMRRAHTIYRGAPLSIEDLDDPTSSQRTLWPVADFDLRRLEREAIARSLRATGGNRTRAARALGISTRTLREKLRRYELV